MRLFNAPGIAPPFSRYSHAAVAEAGKRWLHVSGQLGVRPDGSVLSGIEAQMHQAWDNVFAILDTAGMTKDDIVKVNVFLTRREDVGIYREIRDRVLEGRMPASTLLIVAGLVLPETLVEIEVIAAA
jgi:enamine deaminase RidA (YjgF/YER057c/UK114 family)